MQEIFHADLEKLITTYSATPIKFKHKFLQNSALSLKLYGLEISICMQIRLLALKRDFMQHTSAAVWLLVWEIPT